MAESDRAAEQTTPVPGRSGSSFASDALKLAGGATLAQAIAILTAPVFSRLFAPEAFGTAALFTSTLQVIGVFVCLRYERAIMLPEEDKDASSLLVASLLIAGGMALVSAVGTLLLGGALARWLRAPELAPFLWMLPLAVLAYGISLALRYWNTRARHYDLLSGAQMVSAAGQAAVKLGTGLLGFTGPGSLIGARVLGYAITAVGLGRGAWRQHRRRHLRISWKRITQQLWRYRKFPLVSSWSGLLNTLSVQLPIILLSAFFAQAIVGFYSFGARMVDLPMILIGDSITQVFYQRASAAMNQGEIAPVVQGTVERLIALGVFPMLVLVVIGPELFAIVFGPEWVEAGVYVQILSLWRFLVFVGSPMSTLFGILERLEAGLAFNVVLLLTRFASLAAGGTAGNARLALALYSTSGSVIWLGMILWLLYQSGASIWEATSHSVRYLLYSLPVVLLLVAAKGWWGWPAWLLLVLAGGGALVYYGIVIRQDRTLLEPFVALLDRLRDGKR